MTTIDDDNRNSTDTKPPSADRTVLDDYDDDELVIVAENGHDRFHLFEGCVYYPENSKEITADLARRQDRICCTYCRNNAPGIVDGPGEPSKGHSGELHPSAKLTGADVRDARERYDANPGLSTRDLADEYGVAPCTIRDVLNGTTWSHVGGPTQ